MGRRPNGPGEDMAEVWRLPGVRPSQLECNIAVIDEAFAGELTDTFERDLEDAERVELNAWRARPLAWRILGWIGARIRMFL